MRVTNLNRIWQQAITDGKKVELFVQTDGRWFFEVKESK